MPALITSLGPLSKASAGIVLSHEHVFVDLRTPDHPAHGCGNACEVAEVMAPELERARCAGVGVIVEASTLGVGRRADILAHVSRTTHFPLLIPTGVYREPWIPAWVHAAKEGTLEHWMTTELIGEVEQSGMLAGWIKLSAGDEGITPCEAKVLRAAARAARTTGAVIGSHTIKGRVVLDQLAILDECGLPADRFIWIHTQAEKDLGLHREVAGRGAWLSYDNIGNSDPDETYLDLVRMALDAGLAEKVLLSQDRGWYDPAKLHGGEPKPYTYLIDAFLPKLAAAGVSEKEIWRMTRDNPFSAFAR